MRIAIPTNNRSTVSSHFGRSKGFLIVDIEDGQVKHEEYIPNTFTGHAQHTHTNEPNEEHTHHHGHSEDVHERVAQKFANIDVVISGGMGPGMKARLESANIKVIMTSEKDIQTIIKQFIEGTLKHENISCTHH